MAINTGKRIAVYYSQGYYISNLIEALVVKDANKLPVRNIRRSSSTY